MANRALRGAAASMVGVLFLQFALGIYINLFVSIPRPLALGGMMAGMGAMMAMMTPVVMVHMLVGFMLLAGAVATIPLTARFGRRTSVLAALGLAFILVAGYGGVRFLLYGQHGADSFLMAMAWLGAVGTYLSLWLGAIRQEGRPPAAG